MDCGKAVHKFSFIYLCFNIFSDTDECKWQILFGDELDLVNDVEARESFDCQLAFQTVDVLVSESRKKLRRFTASNLLYYSERFLEKLVER